MRHTSSTQCLVPGPKFVVPPRICSSDFSITVEIIRNRTIKIHLSHFGRSKSSQNLSPAASDFSSRIFRERLPRLPSLLVFLTILHRLRSTSDQIHPVSSTARHFIKLDEKSFFVFLLRALKQRMAVIHRLSTHTRLAFYLNWAGIALLSILAVASILSFAVFGHTLHYLRSIWTISATNII
jgi:hypothetical protein